MDISQLLLKQGLEPLEIAKTQDISVSTKAAHQQDELKDAAKSFEAVFVKQILKQMQETIENASFDPEDTSNQQVHGMYCTFLSDMIAQKGGFGLWEKIYDQMVSMEKGSVLGQQQMPVGSLDEKG